MAVSNDIYDVGHDIYSLGDSGVVDDICGVADGIYGVVMIFMINYVVNEVFGLIRFRSNTVDASVTQNVCREAYESSTEGHQYRQPLPTLLLHLFRYHCQK